MSRNLPRPQVDRVRREANRWRLSMRTSEDGRYYLVRPFASAPVLGTPERGVSLADITAYLERESLSER